MYKSVDMILSDSPFVDNLVYNLKLLAINCIVKNAEEANNAETKISLIESNQYLKCRDDTIKFDEMIYTREVLQAMGFSEDMVMMCMNSPSYIPEERREEARVMMRDYIIEHYDEKNNYYRMLHGLPNVGDPGITVDPADIPEGIIVPEGIKLHELSEEVLITMDNKGTLAYYLEMYPKARYIDYLGAYSIDYLEARRADNFELLYVPLIDNSEVRSKFITTYSKNRSYVIRRVYSNAYKFESEYYDSFITVYILLSTMIDMIDNINEFIIHYEIFDARCIRHMFESKGIPYYSEIPMKYQLKILKNANKLIKYKASNQNLENICAIFGYDNIKLYKFYLLKRRLVDDDGNYIFAYLPDSEEEDETQEYDLKFVKVPMDDQPDEYIKQVQDHLSYDLVTSSDWYWDGGEDHEEIKKQHLRSDFGYKRVKYISIDAIQNFKDLSFGLPFFFNMLYDNLVLEESLLMYIPHLNRAHYFRMTDIFCYLFALTQSYMGCEDTLYVTKYVRLDENNEYYIQEVKPAINYDEETETYSIANMEELSDYHQYVSAFNFRPDTEYLNKYFAEHYVTNKELGITDYKIPLTNIVRYENLMEIYKTNKGVYDHVVKKLSFPLNKREYDIYKTIYDHMLRLDFSLEYFLQPDGTFPDTYTEHIRYRDTILYLSLKEIMSIEDIDTRRKEIDTVVGNVLYAVNDYIDTDEYRFLFNYMPTVSAELIKKYIVKIIEVFKSYKLQIYDIGGQYSFENKYDGNRVNVIGQISDLIVDNTMKDIVRVYDDSETTVENTLKERVSIQESVSIRVYRENGGN